MKVYTGIGSRRTPTDTLEFMQHLARRLRSDGWRLRSGHAPSADLAFEAGAAEECDIFLPWASFGERDGSPRVIGRAYASPTQAAYDLASEHHPNWLMLKRGGQALHARNGHQILGPNLDEPARFIVCWTPDGSLDGQGRNTGGTGQALRLAVSFNVPVFNLQRQDHREQMERYVVT